MHGSAGVPAGIFGTAGEDAGVPKMTIPLKESAHSADDCRRGAARRRHRMTDFNPLSGSILGSAQAQHHVEAEKTRQVRRAQALRKNVALQDDQLEHQVESSEELTPIHDEYEGQGQQEPRQPKKQKDDGENPHIDLKA